MRRFVFSCFLLGSLNCQAAFPFGFWKPAAATGNGLLVSLVSYWKLDETAGSTGIDQQGAHALSVNGGSGVGTAAGIINGGRTSNGAGNAGYLFCTAGNLLPTSGAFTCSFWVKPAALLQNTYPGLVGVYKESTNYGWGVYMHGVTNAVVFGMSANGITETNVTGITLPNTSSIHFIVVTWDGSTMKISSDGGAFTTTSFAGPIFASSGQFQILSRDSTSGNVFNGLIDECGFWTRSLTITDVGVLYNSGAGYAYSNFTL